MFYDKSLKIAAVIFFILFSVVPSSDSLLQKRSEAVCFKAFDCYFTPLPSAEHAQVIISQVQNNTPIKSDDAGLKILKNYKMPDEITEKDIEVLENLVLLNRDERVIAGHELMQWLKRDQPVRYVHILKTIDLCERLFNAVSVDERINILNMHKDYRKDDCRYNENAVKIFAEHIGTLSKREKELLRISLLLHDIAYIKGGENFIIAENFSQQILNDCAEEINLKPEEEKLVVALVALHDLYGCLHYAETVPLQIEEWLNDNLNSQDFKCYFKLASVLYVCDVGSWGFLDNPHLKNAMFLNDVNVLQKLQNYWEKIRWFSFNQNGMDVLDLETVFNNAENINFVFKPGHVREIFNHASMTGAGISAFRLLEEDEMALFFEKLAEDIPSGTTRIMFDEVARKRADEFVEDIRGFLSNRKGKPYEVEVCGEVVKLKMPLKDNVGKEHSLFDYNLKRKINPEPVKKINEAIINLNKYWLSDKAQIDLLGGLVMDNKSNKLAFNESGRIHLAPVLSENIPVLAGEIIHEHSHNFIDLKVCCTRADRDLVATAVQMRFLYLFCYLFDLNDSHGELVLGSSADNLAKFYLDKSVMSRQSRKSAYKLLNAFGSKGGFNLKTQIEALKPIIEAHTDCSISIDFDAAENEIKRIEKEIFACKCLESVCTIDDFICTLLPEVLAFDAEQRIVNKALEQRGKQIVILDGKPDYDAELMNALVKGFNREIYSYYNGTLFKIDINEREVVDLNVCDINDLNSAMTFLKNEENPGAEISVISGSKENLLSISNRDIRLFSTEKARKRANALKLDNLLLEMFMLPIAFGQDKDSVDRITGVNRLLKGKIVEKKGLIYELNAEHIAILGNGLEKMFNKMLSDIKTVLVSEMNKRIVKSSA